MIDCSKCEHHNCCKHVIPELARENSTICRFFNEETGLCNIYANRPWICDSDYMYEHYYKDRMTREEYDERNSEACRLLESNY